MNPPYFSGVIAVTNDGGLNWDIFYPTAWLNDVVFINDSTGWVVGNYGYILHTSDRGVNWTQIECGTTSDLYNIFFFNNGEVGYIFGSNSTLLKYDKTVGIKDKSQPIVSSFNLFQNYPNPFNPITTIEYNIPNIQSSVYVSLIVYDVLGREVATLVNERQTPGHYSTKFDGKNISSGIYFYKLTARTLNTGKVFTRSAKMMLVK